MTMIQDMDKLINGKYCKNKKIDMISIILYGIGYKVTAPGMYINTFKLLGLSQPDMGS